MGSPLLVRPCLKGPPYAAHLIHAHGKACFSVRAGLLLCFLLSFSRVCVYLPNYIVNSQLRKTAIIIITVGPRSSYHQSVQVE